LQNRHDTIQIGDEGFSLVFRPNIEGVTEKLYGNQREARLSTAAIAKGLWCVELAPAASGS